MTAATATDVARQVVADSIEAAVRACRDEFDAACVSALLHGGGVRVHWDGRVERTDVDGQIEWVDP